MKNVYGKVVEFDVKIDSSLNDKIKTEYSLGFYKKEYPNPELVWTVIQEIHNLDGDARDLTIKTLRSWSAELERLAKNLE